MTTSREPVNPHSETIAAGQGETTPLLTSEEIVAHEAATLAALPADDQAAVARSADEGMVSTPVEAATVSTEHITGPASLQRSAGEAAGEYDGGPDGPKPGRGQPPIAGSVDLQRVASAWAGAIWLADAGVTLTVNAEYSLRLADGRTGLVRVTHHVADRYTVEGIGVLG